MRRRLGRERANEGYPYASLIFDGAGALCGTTQVCGIIFAIRPRLWRRRLQYSGRGVGRDRAAQLRQGSDGNGPGYGALIIDAAGNLYGTTSLGGARGCYYGSRGTIFKVAPDGTERVLYALKVGSDGGTPLGGPDRRRVGQSLRHDERWRRNVRLLPLW